MKPPVRFGCRIFLASSEPFQRIIQRAQFCEKAGFDSVLVDDHLLYGTAEAAAPEPFTTVAAIAAATRRIRVGVAVTDLVRRHPAVLAQTLSTLSANFPRRIFLGLGAGDPMNQKPFGLPTEHRYEKLREGLEVIRRLWRSSIEKPQNYRGRFFTLAEAYLQTGRLRQPLPQIYLAAFGPKMLTLTGKAADGWIPHCHTPTSYLEDLKFIEESAHIARREPDQVTPAYYTLASVAKVREKADRNVLGPARYFLALMPEALKKIDPSAAHPGRIWEQLPSPREQRETVRRVAVGIPESDAFNTVIHGTSKDCVEQIQDYRRAGCEEFMLTLVSEGGLWSTSGLFEQMRLFSRTVMASF